MIYKSYDLRNFRDIEQVKSLPRDVVEAIETVGRVLPFRTNNYIVEHLIDWSHVPDDPIFTLTFPRRQMLTESDWERAKRGEIDEIRRSLNPDPAAQSHNVPTLDGERLPGIQHKYPETALFFPSQGQTCHAFCTFCFRWPQFTGVDTHRFAMSDGELLRAYLRRHREITDLLFTGGDPMTMSAKILSRYIDPLLTDPTLEHLRTIRIGTKSLAYWPLRFTTDTDADDILRLFERVASSGKSLAFQAHFNHPRELSTRQVQLAIERIRQTGAIIRTQSPILAHINDDAELWSVMWRRQVALGLVPYYMFVPRDTGAQRFFQIPLVRAWAIFRDAYASTSGICRTVRGPSMSTAEGKIEIVGITNDMFVLRFLQARNPARVGKPFFAELNSATTWYDQLTVLDHSLSRPKDDNGPIA